LATAQQELQSLKEERDGYLQQMSEENIKHIEEIESLKKEISASAITAMEKAEVLDQQVRVYFSHLKKKLNLNLILASLYHQREEWTNLRRGIPAEGTLY
jgi:hypothetical protein